MTGQTLTSYLQLLPTVRPEMAVAWPLDFSQVTVTNATGFGLTADRASVSTGWSFEYEPAPGTSDEIRAMVLGFLRWDPDVDGGPGLVLESSNFATMILAELEVPGMPLLPRSWPQCRFLLYQQLDVTRLRSAITGLLSSLSLEVRQHLERQEPALVGAADDQIARWFLGETHNGQPVQFALPVIPGDVLGGGEDVAGGRRRVRVRARETLADPFFLNLGFYARASSQLSFLDETAVTDPDVRAALLNHDPPLVANGEVRRVSAVPSPGGFSSVQAAVQGAAPGAVVLIADAGPYQAPTVIDIDRPLCILGDTAGDALATPTPALAAVRGNRPPDSQRQSAAWAAAARGAFRVRNVGQGMVALVNLHIRDGADRQGGAIFVDEVDRVWVHNCVFTGNVAYAGGWLAEGFGGAICARHAGILVDNCLFKDNEANSRGGAVGIFGYGWPTIHRCRFENNRSERLNVLNPVSSLPFYSRPDGGAVGVQMATPSTEDQFAHIAAVAPGFEGMDELDAIAHAYSLVGNGLTSDDVGLLINLFAGNISGYWDERKLEASHLLRVHVNESTFVGNSSADDGGAIYATGLVRASCVNNVVTANAAGSNGGGIRISTACDFIVEGGEVLSNQSNRRLIGYLCEQDRKDRTWGFDWTSYAGGGIASRTSNLRLVNVHIAGNLAHRYAGGGVFFTSTDDGKLPIPVVGMGTDWNVIRELLVRDPATGAAREAFSAFSLEVEQCTIIDNSCGWCAGAVARPAPQNPAGRCGAAPTDSDAHDIQHAKGGGIYALRYAEDPEDVDKFFPRLIVRILAGTALGGNVAAFSPTATELFIADFTRPAPNNPASDSAALSRDAGGALLTPFLYGAAS